MLASFSHDLTRIVIAVYNIGVDKEKFGGVVHCVSICLPVSLIVTFQIEAQINIGVGLCLYRIFKTFFLSVLSAEVNLIDEGVLCLVCVLFLFGLDEWDLSDIIVISKTFIILTDLNG